VATFVLVHGAWHGGWCYAEVVRLLSGKGHQVHAPTLTGLAGTREGGAKPINLTTHVNDIVAIIQAGDLRDVILCGHSYAGMVITGVAGQIGHRIRTLFYLDAAVPEDGQSAFDIVGTERTLGALETAGHDGTHIPPPKADVFQSKEVHRAWIDRRCNPHPIGTLIQKLHHTGKEALVPFRTYVLARRYGSQANHTTYDRVRRLPGWRSIALDCGHEVMMDEPAMLAALLIDEIART